jgi:hypothetical protein
MLRRKRVQHVIFVMIVIMQVGLPIQFVTLDLGYAQAGAMY